MDLLPYEQFSALRIQQFLPPDAEIGAYECDRQAWRCEYHATFGDTTLFCFADKPPTVLSAIYTDVGGSGLPVAAADAILRALQLPVDTTVTPEQLLEQFGAANYAVEDEGDGLRFLRFLVGSRWPYYIGFSVRSAGGLIRFWIARKDFFLDEDQGDGG
jgi:hypothetical protein